MTSGSVMEVLQYVSTAGFVILFAVVARRWLASRDRQRMWLAAATGLLAFVSVVGRVTAAFGTEARALDVVVLAAFVASGYALLRFRDELVPLSRAVKRTAEAVAVAVTLVASIVPLPDTIDPSSPGPTLVLVGVLAVWVVFVGEPVIRLWRVARAEPPVLRARLRALCGGYGLIVLILLVAVPASSSGAGDAVGVITQVVVLVAIPMLYVAFEPPVWLRRIWRGSIEGDLGRATSDLLAFTDDRQRLASRALGWARQLVGARGAFLRTSDGMLAVDGLSAPEAERLAASLEARNATQSLDAGTSAIVLPLGGAGVMGVVSGALTPVFGSDEVDRLIPFAASIGTALDRVRVEEERQRYAHELELANRELARTNEDLERFAFIASHDLQEPLRMVTGYVQLLARNYQGRLDADADEFIGYTVEGVQRMRQLLDDLLAFSRIGTRGEPMTVVEMAEVVDAVLADLAPAIGATGAEVTVGPLPAVRADRGQMIVLVRHLIDNALKFRSERPAKVEISAVRRGEDWEFSVADDGIGIDPAFAERIFVIFQRLHPRGEYPGTGVGLAMCQRIVDRHGGRISVESRADAGATFRFTLPSWQEEG